MAVDLEEKGFALKERLGLSACPAGSSTFTGQEVVQLQVRVFGYVVVAPGLRVGAGQLKADPQVIALRFGSPRQQVVKCGWKIRVSIGRDLNKDRWVGWVPRLTTITRGLRPCARSEPSVSRHVSDNPFDPN